MTSPFGNSPSSGGPSWGVPGQSPFGPGATSGAAPGSGITTGSPITFGPANGGPGTSTDRSAPTADLTPKSGPKGILWSAGGTAALGVILGVVAFFSGSPTDGIYHILAIIGWALSGIVTFILLGLYTGRDTKLRAESFYVADPGQAALYRTAGVIAFIGVIITAVEIALWISKTVGA